MAKINHGESVYLTGMIVAIIAALAIGFIGGTYYGDVDCGLSVSEADSWTHYLTCE